MQTAIREEPDFNGLRSTLPVGAIAVVPVEALVSSGPLPRGNDLCCRYRKRTRHLFVRGFEFCPHSRRQTIMLKVSARA